MTLKLSHINKYLEIKLQGTTMSSYGQKLIIFGKAETLWAVQKL